jgi:hypothetical protein
MDATLFLRNVNAATNLKKKTDDMFQPQGKNELAKTCLKKYQLFRLFTVKR